MINRGNVNPSIILSIYLASGQVMQPLREAINDFASAKTTKALRKSIESTFSSNTQPAFPQTSSQPQSAVLEKVSGKQIDFAFGNKQILKNASFVINKNDKILLTGESGMGKSTIFNLIMGGLHPIKGQITYSVNDKDEKQVDANTFALIQQNPYVFNETIRFNLGLGLNFPDDILYSCLKSVGLDKELGSDPLDYLCKNGGSNLSGGQRERLEIARAFVFNRQVILADEIDSSLDAKNAFQIEALLAKIDKTVIMISHHIDLKQAQQFGFRHWVLDSGELKEK